MSRGFLGLRLLERSVGRGLLALLAAVLVPSAVQAAPVTPELQRIIDAAQKEGTLDLAWAETIIGGSEGIKRIEAGFNKQYGTKIVFKFTPMAGMARMAGRLAMEFAANQPAFIDLFLVSAADIPPMLRRDMLAQVDWAQLAPDRFIPAVIDADGRAVKLGTGFTGADYNTELAPMVPKNFADFLRPEWKGKVATTDYAAGFEALGSSGVWGPQKTIAYMQALLPQLAGLITCGDEERLAVGEFAGLVTNCTGDIALQWKAKGAPVDRMIPRDAPVRRFYYMTLPKNSAHPNAAKLLITYMLSEQGQLDCWDIVHMDLHLLPGSRSLKISQDLEAQGYKFTDFTVAYYIDHPEGRETQEKIIQMLRDRPH